MAVHKLTKNFRASEAVLDWVNKHNPRGDRSEQSDAQTTGLNAQSEGSVLSLDSKTGPNNVASKIIAALGNKQKVALLCRTNEECYRWQDFLENYSETDPNTNTQTQPLKKKTRLIDEKPTKIHYTWPVWWFFHGYADLHPVLSDHFESWKTTLGLNEFKCNCAGKGKYCVTSKTIVYPKVKHTNIQVNGKNVDKVEDDGTIETRAIDVIPYSCKNEDRRLLVNGRLRSGENPTFKEAMIAICTTPAHKAEYEVNKQKSEVIGEEPITIPQALQEWDKDEKLGNKLSTPLVEEWNTILSFLETQFAPDTNVTWHDIWQAFEDYYEDPSNLLATGKVTISTIHKSKGLEFDVVFLCQWSVFIEHNHYKDTEPLALESSSITRTLRELNRELKDFHKFPCDWSHDGEYRKKNEKFNPFNSTLGAEGKNWYVGGSRARETLYIIPNAVKARSQQTSTRIAHINEINPSKAAHKHLEPQNAETMKKVFGFKDFDNSDYSYVFHGIVAKLSMQGSWTLYRKGELPNMQKEVYHNDKQINNYQNWLSYSGKKYLEVLHETGIPIMVKSEYGWHPGILPTVRTKTQP
jgi:hypothetical protein